MRDDRAARRFGLGMMLLFWALLIGSGSWWFHLYLEERRNPNTHLVQVSDGGEPVRLKRNAGGHFVATGRINGEPVEFMIDTGASYVALSEELAERLGLAVGASAWFQTASGRSRGYLTTLDEVALGGLSARRVRGAINPGMSPDLALLGMSFLNHFDIQIRGEEMILSPPRR
ncbi:TIGR02281 family clan AA aspartic protease [Halomonas pacifica]|uniref:TIGR02281 family clan AA aspartic protease n=1 Tax=Bisbaumannia pacifica TaxID=77098 RepID=A0ABD4L0X0_9GAMM|nr:TIGR02281 family clan AA aspartic protease [Halomonas pacifica]MBH8579219.1 TIGR02281 family clan AA aspartic protease [Halomonas pacifica]MDC8802024.1 TIGR02281 family clan AA aspartic protease [Halomonas pacifica]